MRYILRIYIVESKIKTIIIWNLTSCGRFDSPQLENNLVSNITNLVLSKSSHELTNYSKLRILEIQNTQPSRHLKIALESNLVQFSP